MPDGIIRTDRKERAFELDLLRGLDLIWVIFMHMSYDIRYIFGIDAFDYLDGRAYWTFGEPLVLCIFVGISGVCCSFSRNNIRRGAKLLTVALAVTLGTYLAQTFLGIDCLIVFNVLHLLSVGILIYALILFIEKKTGCDPGRTNLIMALTGLWIMAIGPQIWRYDKVIDGYWLIPFGIQGKEHLYMGDYMPMIPWIGVFLIGVIIGRTCYKERKTLFPKAPSAFRKLIRPVEFIGRHSLIIYVVHQPVIIGIIYLILRLAGRT